MYIYKKIKERLKRLGTCGPFIHDLLSAKAKFERRGPKMKFSFTVPTWEWGRGG